MNSTTALLALLAAGGIGAGIYFATRKPPRVELTPEQLAAQRRQQQWGAIGEGIGAFLNMLT